ncbi:hypothetical protein [Isoalcanivorax beigongshangi]|uniref:Uncharacterized protein n=1 Tax=Isoalcanivorax beigongshangi TaxID=3238810 RepID=A0ABV4AFN9_9GAMM
MSDPLKTFRNFYGKAAPLAIAVLMIALAIVPDTVLAGGEKKTVYFAGLALSGTAAESAASFPHTLALMQERSEEGGANLQQELWDAISSAPLAHLHLETNLAEHSDIEGAVALAMLVDWENVSREKLGDTTKMVADLHAQALLFDYSSKRVLAAYPVDRQLIHVVQGDPDAGTEASLIRALYFNESDNIFHQFARRLQDLEVRASYGNAIRVMSVALEDQALEMLRAHGQDPDVFQGWVADQFGKRFSDRLQVPFIPYAKGVAIGASMAARFANGDVYQLELPEPDYRVHFVVRGFKKVLLDSNSAEAAWAYGTYLNVRIANYDDSRVYLDAPFKFGAVKKVPSSAQQLDDWTAFRESIFSLLDQICVQVTQQDRRWLNKWSDGREVQKQLRELNRQVIERSR